MAWQNLFTYDPGASVDVYKNGSLVDPGDYAAEEIAVDITDGRVTFTYPGDSEDKWDVVAVPSDPLSLPVRLFEVAGTPWPEGSGEPYACGMLDGDPPPPESFDSLGSSSGVTYNFDVDPYIAFGVGTNLAPS